MELLFARTQLKDEPKKVSLEAIKEILSKKGEQIFYFDKENSHKDMMKLVTSLENNNLNIYFREIKYGLSDDEYMYEVHVL